MDRSPSFPHEADSSAPKESDRSVHRAAFRSAVTAADAYHATRAAVRLEGGVLRLGNRFLDSPHFREIAFLAAGNAAGSQALALQHALGDRITQGLVASALPVPEELPFRSMPLDRALPGSAPGIAAGAEALALAEGLGEKDLLIVLLSGGAAEALAAPPGGVTGPELAGWIEALRRAGGSSRLLALATAALAEGAADGRLAASAHGAEVVTIAVDPGDGAALVGAAPTRRLTREERDETRAALERLGVLESLPAATVARLAPGPTGPGALPRGVARPVVVAQPSDALRGASDALVDRHYRSRLGGIGLPGDPAELAECFGERLEALARDELPPSGSSDRGLAVLATSTLELPEGVDPGPSMRVLLAALPATLRRRGTTVGVYATTGDGAGGSPAGAIVSAGGPPARADPLPMRPGITEAGVVLVALVPTGPPKA